MVHYSIIDWRSMPWLSWSLPSLSPGWFSQPWWWQSYVWILPGWAGLMNRLRIPRRLPGLEEEREKSWPTPKRPRYRWAQRLKIPIWTNNPSTSQFLRRIRVANGYGLLAGMQSLICWRELRKGSPKLGAFFIFNGTFKTRETHGQHTSAGYYKFYYHFLLVGDLVSI